MTVVQSTIKCHLKLGGQSRIWNVTKVSLGESNRIYTVVETELDVTIDKKSNSHDYIFFDLGEDMYVSSNLRMWNLRRYDRVVFR